MNTKMVIVMRKDLNMRRGKQIAQGSHASMSFLTKGGGVYCNLGTGVPQVDYGDFTEYQVRCLIAEYCKSVTLGTTGWGVSFKDWVELRGIAKHDGMFRLIKLEEENETKFSPWGFEV